VSVSSYRTILRSSSIIGGASVINVLAGIAKMKVAAVLLGPAGVGLIGLYLNLIQTASTVASLGIAQSGIRQIAARQAEGGPDGAGLTRQALLWSSLILALAGAAMFWISGSWIARIVLGDESRADEVAWLALGVALTVAAGSQAALLTGMRRVGDLARVQVGTGVFGAALGMLALWLLGRDGLLVAVLAAPAATFVLGLVYVARLGPASAPRPTLSAMAGEWRVLAHLGVALMIGGLVNLVGHLVVRTLVQRELGGDALGHFQAAWAIGATYLGFVLGAMGTDYYPRLAAAIGDHTAAVRLVNEQTEVALLLCGPVLVTMLGLAPWVIPLLYSAEFGPAVEILRWQLLGDILKVMSWPLGFVLLASGVGKTFLGAEALAISIFVLCVFLGLPLIGVTATGVAFLALYLAYLPLVHWLARRRIGFRWSRSVRWQATAVIAAALAVEVAARWSDSAGAALGLALAGGMSAWALMRLAEKAEAGGLLAPLARMGRRIKRWMNIKA
jgi:PST family polysaccharide transporter